jgi:5-methylcytosine-specific restriction endonuclease McrA
MPTAAPAPRATGGPLRTLQVAQTLLLGFGVLGLRHRPRLRQAVEVLETNLLGWHISCSSAWRCPILTEHHRPTAVVRRPDPQGGRRGPFCHSGPLASPHALRRPYECAECRRGDTWNGRPLTLHVDHIDGRFWNCRPENLRFLCPNCDSQTATYAGRNRSTSRTGLGLEHASSPACGRRYEQAP